MREQRSSSPGVARLSALVYDRLLVLYPQAFRREYGAQMTQVFRDNCRDAWRLGGALAMLGLWLRTLGDLAVNALGERMNANADVSRAVFIRVAGLAGMIAGAWYMLLFIFMFSIMQTPYAYSPLWPFQSAVLAATIPGTWALFFMALYGLHLRLEQLLERQEHPRDLSLILRLARGVTCGGAVLSLVAGPLALHSAVAASNWPVAFYVVVYIYGAHIGFMGYIVLGIGLVGTGLVALRTRAFGFWSWVPMLASALALLNGVFVSLHVLQTPCCAFDPLASRGSNDIQLAFFLLWSVGWIVLGYRFWTRKGKGERLSESYALAPAADD